MAGGDFEKNVHQLTGSHWKKNVPLCGHYDVVFFLQNIHNYQFQKLLVSWSYQFQNRTLSRFQKTKHTSFWDHIHSVHWGINPHPPPQKHHTLFFGKPPPPPLNLQTVQAPPF